MRPRRSGRRSRQTRKKMQVEELAAGAYIIRWKAVVSNRFDSKALKLALPEIYKQFCKLNESRRFSIV